MNRVGEEKYNTYGTLMRIIKYNRYSDIIVEFQDEYKFKLKTTYDRFQKGMVKNPYDKSIYNVGYIGEGKYKASNNSKITKVYAQWFDMIRRCYDPYYINKFPTYIDCYVCDEWLCFQNFADWYENNYYEIKGEKMELDKDILHKGNKIYSPITCIFVPKRINYLFLKSTKIRGEYPIGVSYCKRNNCLISQCSILNDEGDKSHKYLGKFSPNKPFQAFTIYKQFKEKYIKEVADKYKDLIPQKLYDAMYKWTIEIND